MKKLGIAVAGVCAAIAANISCAENEFTFIPSIAYQNKHLEFEQKYTAGLFDGTTSDFSVDIPTLNFTATAVYGKFYASYKIENELAAAPTEVDENRVGGNADIYFLNTGRGDETDVERNDQTITVGMNVWDSLNIFAGFMEGKTTLSPDPYCSFGGCAVNPGIPFNNAFVHSDNGLEAYEQEYTEKGPFVGMSYGYRVADIGTLSASVAYAVMDGEYSDNYKGDPAPFDEQFAFEGDSTGFSLGLTWSAPLNERVGYFFDVRRQAYTMDAKDKSGNVQWVGSTVETDETMLNLTAGIQMYF